MNECQSEKGTLNPPQKNGIHLPTMDFAEPIPSSKLTWQGKSTFLKSKYIFQIGGFSNQLPEGTLVFQGENTTNHIPCSNKDVADRTDGFGDEFSVFLDVPGT